ncbi:hypothetical protein GHK92_05335 [Nocardioides sp. dk4132]|uniref:hypothetical protein n=1 Tax=unclassified Nocardioides TaxID=2615069 RepID=UPI00129803E2|nr:MULTISPECIES: hypothetical protein [unclassified Nocardioides]MQW75290.1 hypothetical protein [Nocardioides sp. dk4132]QGA07560.1 hypothetical protein GFH29_09275 [Nocardioides sp. dk884]
MAEVEGLRVCSSVLPWHACGSRAPWTGTTSAEKTSATQPHQIDDLLSIDHLAVPAAWAVADVQRHPAFHDGDRLSDHDAYAVEIQITA